MGDDVMLSYIKNSGKAYSLSGDDMLYLNSQGVSQAVVNALLQTKGNGPAPAPAPLLAQNSAPPPAAAPPPAEVPPPAPPGEGGLPAPEVNFNYFHDQLAPFGTWVDVGGVTYWRPDSAIAANPDWRPYYDMGKWVETDNGLFWQSEYTWGDIPFHYGRWIRHPVMGWLWAPDYEWGPAWVFWRHAEADQAIGWAPLPFGAVYVGESLMFNGVAVGLDFDFGLGEGCFTFVGYDHFHEGFFRMRGHEWGYHIDHDRMHGFYGRSVIRNEFGRDRDGRFVNHGIGRERMERATHGRVERAGMEERRPVGDRNKLAADRRDAKPGAGKPEPGKPGAGRPEASKASAPSKVYRPPASASKPAGKSAPAPSGGKKK
jgi:hypothetical protein